MGDPTRLRPDEVEILVARELRKAGVELSALTVRARTSLTKGGNDYVMEMLGSARIAGSDRRLLVECRREGSPVRADAVRALGAKLGSGAAEHGLMFSTSGFEAEAVRAARTHGIPLLAVADGRAAFARSPWASGGQPPAWIPEYMSELVDLDAGGQLRRHLVLADQPRAILDRLTPEA